MHHETKSSAGDKYETGREMLKQEMEKLGSQLEEAVKQRQLLLQIDISQNHEHVQQGALVITDKGNFYMCIGLGQLHTNYGKFIVVSPGSPIAQKMIDLKRGDKFIFNAQGYLIEHIL